MPGQNWASPVGRLGVAARALEVFAPPSTSCLPTRTLGRARVVGRLGLGVHPLTDLFLGLSCGEGAWWYRTCEA